MRQFQFKRTAISGAVAQAAAARHGRGPRAERTAPRYRWPPVAVTGQRAALQSAQKLKQNAEEIVDSVVAEEAGKLPDKSITEVLQRVVGVTMNRNRGRGDPEHFSVEGRGIAVRGLTWGASNLNGREMFSAGWPGRELSWADVPPELMAGVDVYKNPSAEKIEGGVSGLVDLRTWLPFDFKGTKGFITLKGNYAELGRKTSPGASGLFTTQWDAESGRWGVLVDLAYNRTTVQNQALQVGAYFPHTDVVGQEGKTVWAPESASWRTNTERHRAHRPVWRAAVEEERHAVGADLLRVGLAPARHRAGVLLEQRGSVQERDHERRSSTRAACSSRAR